jgi:PWWP domain
MCFWISADTSRVFVATKRNGNTNEHAEGKSDKDISGDTEMTDAPNPDDSEKKSEIEPEVNAGKAKGAAPRTNGAPGSNRKVKRKSVGVPEHKTKLNKKKSMPVMVDRDCQPGEYYFARMKGFPKWPCIISDDEMLPPQMVRTRPITAKRLDGTYREEYAPGGSKAHDRSFPIMFLQSNEL